MNKKPKILLVSDDLRMPTGVATMSQIIVRNTHEQIEWVQMAGARKHPEPNKIIRVDDIVTLYTVSDSFGNSQIFNAIIEAEKPDGVLFFTDPRYFTEHFQTEYIHRQKIPFMFYTIWDNYPIPMYNFGHYNSCDGLFCISKQTKDIVTKVLGENSKDKVINHVPHGVESDLFKPMDINSKMFKEIIPTLDKKNAGFVYLFSNKNMSRKRPSDVIMAFNMIWKELSTDEKKKTHLIMNTTPVDAMNGTDLLAVVRDICEPDISIHFLPSGAFRREQLPILYNIADVTICNSDAEGHGLAVTESLLCGTPVIATVTGGIQDQLGFKDDVLTSRHLNWQNDRYLSNEEVEFEIHGDWAYPLFPDASNLIGSVVTPYIFEDRVSIYQLYQQMKKAYDDKESLHQRGLTGRQWMIDNGFSSENMCNLMVQSIIETINNFTPRVKNELMFL